MTKSRIIHGDCLAVLPTLPKAKMIFADPPDNIGAKYEGYNDSFSSGYQYLLRQTINLGAVGAKIFWLSYNAHYHSDIYLNSELYDSRQFIWRFTFGQHRQLDCGNGYRPLLRIMQKGASIYPASIRVPSARQLKYQDKRANPRGRVPDDVWEFPRVCGTFKEKRRWAVNQHPEALIERIVKFSTRKGDLVIDMFAGSGTVNRVCQKLGRPCIGIEISPYYCQKIAEETGLKVAKA
jgi:site-specific DNA-methyltransferase (adenine-specific)